MINGAHVVIYSKDPAADRAFLKEVIGLSHVDVGNGWLIFGLPPAEVACHPSEEGDRHELYLMCDDVKAFADQMRERQVPCGNIQETGWGVLVAITLPGGGELGVYQPKHERPAPMEG